MDAGTKPFKRRTGFPVGWLLLALAAFMPACASAVETPPPTPTARPTLPPPASATSIPPTSTPQAAGAVLIPTATATPLPSATAKKPEAPTPFPNFLEAFHLTYDPAATLELPPRGSIDMLFWGDKIPVKPVDTKPRFIPAPTPQGMEHSADPLIKFGCELDYWGWATCPPDNPLQRFGCDYLVDPRGISYGLEPDVPLVAICLKRTEEHEAAKINGLYLTGCAFRDENHYLFEVDGQYILVSNENELKQRFAPIDSPQEAVSYAQLVTGLDAMYSFDYDPTLMYFSETITATHATQIGDSFEINLFNKNGCGCEPWFTTQIKIRVDRTGQVTWLDAVPVFMTTGWSCAD
jgi:hypothetical protein